MANDSVTETFARLVEFIANKFLRGEVTLADLLNLDDLHERGRFKVFLENVRARGTATTWPAPRKASISR